MASGHVNRTQRPNTWLHRPSLRREDSPCQLGAVHTWPIASFRGSAANGRFGGYIRDRNYKKGTGCFAHDVVGAELALATYLAGKHVRGVRIGSRDPDQIPIADVLTVYLTDIVPGHSRPKETKA